MPSVLQINTTVNTGSTGRIAEEIGQKIIDLGWSSYIAYGRGKPTSKSDLFKVGSTSDMVIHGIITRLFDKHGLGSAIATKSLLEYINDTKPDIIHLHNIHGYYLNYPILFSYLSGLNIPIIWTLHDCWSYTGHCSHYSAANCIKWRTQCFKCPNLRFYPKSLFFDRSEKNYIDKKEAFTLPGNLTIVPVSKWLANEVENSFLNHHTIKTISNGVNIKLFSPQISAKEKYGVKNKFLILGVASVWNKRKGLNDFINLSKFLSKEEVIILVGLSKNQTGNLPDNIICIPRTESIIQLAELYSSADVFVNFSVEETFGLTIAESLACGTPAIVYNSTACPEIVSDETGFVVAPHDIETAYNVIQLVKQKGKSHYSQNCRKRAVELFNKEDRWQEYISLYKSLL